MNNRTFTSILLCILLCTTSSCYQKIYMRVSAPNPGSSALESSISDKEVIILHDSSANAFLIADAVTQKDTLDGKVRALPNKYKKYLDSADAKVEYRGERAEQVKKQLHLYTTKSVVIDQDIRIGLNSFRRIETFEFNKKATRSVRIISTATILACIVVAVAAAHSAMSATYW